MLSWNLPHKRMIPPYFDATAAIGAVVAGTTGCVPPAPLHTAADAQHTMLDLRPFLRRRRAAVVLAVCTVGTVGSASAFTVTTRSSTAATAAPPAGKDVRTSARSCSCSRDAYSAATLRSL